MTTDETTQLLAKPAADEGRWPEESDCSATRTTQIGKEFGLWQIGALCGILLAYADTSLVWATHETVSSHFDKLGNSSWMMTSFTIGYCVTLPLYGRLSDSYGRLRPLIAAYCAFCIGCTICGIGQAYWQVILGRITTGCGASGIISLASIIIADIAAPSNVAVLRSYVNIASTVGLSLGGPLGGFLGGTVGWRWSFLGQPPIAGVCCVLIARGLRMVSPILEEHERQLEECENAMKQEVLAFDFPGAITLAIGISAFLTVIDLQDQRSWGHPLVLSITIVGAISILAFLALETYPGNRELLIPLRLVKTEIGVFCAGQLLIVGSCHGFVSQIAPYFKNTRGVSDAEGGGQIIPSSIGNALGNLIAGQVIKRFGSYKRLSLSALFLNIATSLLILFQWSHPINTLETLITFPFGFFAGIVLATQFIGLYICSPKKHMATAISMYYMSQQIGIALGISFSSSLLKQKFKATLQEMLVNVPEYQEIIKKILVDSSLVTLLPTEVKTLVQKSYLNSFWVVPGIPFRFAY
ncbi:major facilitator superfamily domain-containing protein [Amylocarpus encephaloides]|uniref:Major facilitator superfamily domain-containing protein n=1 Tax=Amylocarpus encephaloides TaxID=45428 RepID=A0A9P8C4J8_9HELO|nr:major facilitator superfamily domain-containing protein [Amylocarpus encephaloides]